MAHRNPQTPNGDEMVLSIHSDESARKTHPLMTIMRFEWKEKASDSRFGRGEKGDSLRDWLKSAVSALHLGTSHAAMSCQGNVSELSARSLSIVKRRSGVCLFALFLSPWPVSLLLN